MYRNYPPRPPYRRGPRPRQEPPDAEQPQEAVPAPQPPPAAGVDDQVVAEFEKQLIAARREVDEANDRYLRARAELDNVRKRAERQAEQRYDVQRRELVLSLLPVVDNLERALAHAEPASSLGEGVEAVYRQFLRKLEDQGVTRLDPSGEVFDPAYHEAVDAVVSSQPSGTILEVLLPGYVMNEQLVRPAQVRVAR